jgi:hypothetical protein
MRNAGSRSGWDTAAAKRTSFPCAESVDHAVLYPEFESMTSRPRPSDGDHPERMNKPYGIMAMRPVWLARRGLLSVR